MDNPEQKIDPKDTSFVLPIICTHCQKQIDLAMVFFLLPPTETIVAENKNNDNSTETEA